LDFYYFSVPLWSEASKDSIKPIWPETTNRIGIIRKLRVLSRLELIPLALTYGEGILSTKALRERASGY